MKQTDYRIRQATEEDQPDILPFVMRLMQPLYPPGAYHVNPHDLNAFKDVYVKPQDAVFFLALDRDGNWIGTAAIRPYDERFNFLQDAWEGKRVCEMTRFYLIPSVRRQGIGSMLYEHAEQFAVEAGYEHSYMHTSVYLPGGYPFWLSRGYEPICWETEQIVHMRKTLLYPDRASATGNYSMKNQ